MSRTGSYRICLKRNLTLRHKGGELAAGEIAALISGGVENAQLSGAIVTTSIAVLQEEGPPQPWIITMNAKP